MQPPRMKNRTRLLAEPRLLVGKDGEQLVVIVKATYERYPGITVLDLAAPDDRRPIRSADVPWGDPERSSIKYPSDLCIAKPGTDVVVVASAHAPKGKPVGTFDATVRVGPLEKTVRIFGPRVWSAGGGITAPRPTLGIELRYDHAWGGIDPSDPESPVEEPRNPVGTGMVRDLADLTHEAAIEDPSHLITTARSRPPPAGLGAIGRHWEPRRRFLGTYDEAWLTERAPLLPLDHDDRSNLCASPGLSATSALRGGEEVALLNLTEGGGSVTFYLPRVRLSVELAGKDREPVVVRPHLDTILLDTLHPKAPADVCVELVWRAAFVPTRRLPDATLRVTEEPS